MYIEPLAHRCPIRWRCLPRLSHCACAGAQAQPARESWHTIINHFDCSVNFQ
jgi:hypothetical protein